MIPVIAKHKAVYDPIADLSTWRAMPTHSVRHIDPFLFLNHHGPQTYKPNNNGLPFGPHPHRGFETLTYVLKGDIVHADSSTGKSKITAGGIQWMTAGSGVVHSEISSEEFKEKGGEEEVLQLWMNLPSHLKMTEPNYIGLQKDQIPVIKNEDGYELQLISGNFNGTTGPVNSITELFTSLLNIKSAGNFKTQIPKDHTILLYMVRGEAEVNGENIKEHELVEMGKEGGLLHIQATGESTFVFCYGRAYNEPIVAQGPFVMNSREEIMQAFEDYQTGKMGSL